MQRTRKSTIGRVSALENTSAPNTTSLLSTGVSATSSTSVVVQGTTRSSPWRGEAITSLPVCVPFTNAHVESSDQYNTDPDAADAPHHATQWSSTASNNTACGEHSRVDWTGTMLAGAESALQAHSGHVSPLTTHRHAPFTCVMGSQLKLSACACSKRAVLLEVKARGRRAVTPINQTRATYHKIETFCPLHAFSGMCKWARKCLDVPAWS